MSDARSVAPAERGDIGSLVTRLVQEAPTIDESVRGDLVTALAAVAASESRAAPSAAASLAQSIATVIGLLGRPVDPGIALPALAMACATLADVVSGRLTAREAEAARYEIDTLRPLPGAAPIIAAPDVPLTRLKRP